MDEEPQDNSPILGFPRILIFSTMFLVMFPVADLFTSWMLAQSHPRPVPSDYLFEVPAFPEDFGLQRQNSEKRSDVWKEFVKPAMRKAPLSDKKKHLHMLRDILRRPKASKPIRSFEILDIFTNNTHTWKMQSEVEVQIQTPKILKFSEKSVDLVLNWDNETTILPAFFPIDNEPKCRALAPIPPAPFSPRRRLQRHVPRHQPCLVHVNESKWTCQKNLPAVIYKPTLVSYRKPQRAQICGKKASQSMRTVSKPTDQCDSRHFSKFTPRRKHIAYKTPLPCKVQSYQPSSPKPTRKPSTSTKFDDWHHKRGLHRAHLRSRA